MGEHQVDLLEGHAARIQAQGPGDVLQNRRRFGGHVLGFLNDIFGPARIRYHPGKTDVSLTLLDLDPFLIGKHIQTGRKKDVLFFVDHIPDRLDGFFQRRYGALRVGFRKGLAGLFEAGANVIVDGPHHLGRSGKVVGLQHGKELILLAGVMNINLG